MSAGEWRSNRTNGLHYGVIQGFRSQVQKAAEERLLADHLSCKTLLSSYFPQVNLFHQAPNAYE